MASVRWVGRRAADLGRSLADTFVRDNRLLPPILALLALFVFAWVLAGVFIGGTDEQKPVAHRSEFAQADGAAGSDPAAPEVDNPNVDSYAAFRSKDPFRQVLVFARTTPEGTSSAPGGRANGGRPAGAGNRRAADADRDGLPDRMEAKFGQEPGIPDTDGDSIPDGLDDSDGDGIPDGVEGGAAAGGGNNRAGGSGGGRGEGGRSGRGDGLLDSGGTLSPP
ncbi:MAG: hypothetical protein ACR2FR_07230 [Rubrobacter sp.]|nr:hypothetical protein [Rubrobacteraceae bacterium]MDQ3251436.1 hypothetical protein [Actinomycetota bacterium]MDQ3435820.1 hypothetical protein [Actinomycetota bacterium]